MKNENPHRFSDVYAKYKDKLYSYVYYRVNGDKDLAEDIISDVFIKTYEKFDSYNPNYAISTWLYSITRNSLIDHYRKHRATIDIDSIPIVAEDDALYHILDQRITGEQIDKALAKLTPLQQTCIREKFFAGKSGEEISQQLSISHPSVRKHISRGLKALRNEFILYTFILYLVFDQFQTFIF